MGALLKRLAGILLALGFVGLPSVGNRAAAADAPSPVSTGNDAGSLREVPGAEAVSRAEALVRDIFREDYAWTSAASKQTLARKLLAKASTVQDDPGGLYVLLREARDLAVSSKDAVTALGAVALLHDSFQMPLRDRLEDWIKVASLPQPVEAHRAMAERLSAFADRSIAADEYELAVRAAQQARSSTRQSTDVALAARAEAKLTRVRQLEKQYEAYRSALTKLEREPDDKAANFAAGTFLCEIKGDWNNGLPMLAKGSDAPLAELAVKDLATPTSTDEQVALADEWWEVGETQKRPEIVNLTRTRAAAWYRTALPRASGLVREKLRTRLDTVTVTNGNGKVNEVGASRSKTVDLLSRVDVKRDPMRGEWKKTEEGLLGGSSFMSMLRIPYEPGEEYDFVVEFTRLEGRYGILQLIWCSAGKCQVDWVVMSQHGFTGFGRVAGKAVGNTPEASVAGKPTIEAGRRHTSLVQVRKWGLAAHLDGKKVAEYRTDFKDLSAHSGWDVGAGMLGLGANSPVVFHRIEVVELESIKGPASKP